MDLYFSPLACSMATRIALYEAGSQANFIEVDPKTKRVLKDDSDFYAVNPLGLVPVVKTDDGVTLTENAAILQHVAERLSDSNIGAKPGIERSRLQQWLCFIGTEVHKSLFTPLLGKTTPAEVKAYTLEKYLSRLEYLDKYLTSKYWVLATMAEAHIGLDQESDGAEQLKQAFELKPVGWMKESTESQIARLRALLEKSPLRYISPG